MHTRSTRGVSSQNGWCRTAVLGSDRQNQLQLIKCEGRGNASGGNREREREIREQKEEGEERSGQPVEPHTHRDQVTRSVTVKPSQCYLKTAERVKHEGRELQSLERERDESSARGRAVCAGPSGAWGRSAPGSWPCWRGMGGTMPAARGEASR